jgi:uncharacterized protein YhjY with autotransporter beta-barrel domain
MIIARRLASLAILCLPVALSSNAFAKDAGCGLGGLIWKSNTKLLQLFAVTTNGSFGSQTFGITFGTSGCSAKGIVQSEEQQLKFAHANFETLRQEIAQGRGDSVVAFSDLLGCTDASALGMHLQTSYGELFPEADATPLAFLANAKASVKSDAALSGACTAI